MSISLDTIISFCKRKGFVYPSSEIYGGFAAIYDLGPYGTELANAVKRIWWKSMVQVNSNIIGLDSSIFMSPRIWEASGHVSGFSDPLAECKNCHQRIRVDKVLNELGIIADEKMDEVQITHIFTQQSGRIKCPTCGMSDFTNPRNFNLLVRSNLGNFTDDPKKEPVYLRGETCQGIYVNFKNILKSHRVRIPFGIAQIGKAFRNEITARQFIFRTREFEQMEMQYFTHPNQATKEYEKLKQMRWDYYLKLGISPANLQWHRHENLVFYAIEAFDIEYRFPFGFDEIEGIHARSDYDLTQHEKHSGCDLHVTDPTTNESYIPHVIESSAGVGRTVLALLCEAYHEEPVNGNENRIVLKLNPEIAPIKIAVFPLLRNKPELVEGAQNIFDNLKWKYMCEFDDNGNIGKRYRRQDEIGTPYCITYDFDSLNNHSVTVRNRDTMEQVRISCDKLESYFYEQLGF